MRRIALLVAIIGFLALAAVGMVSGVPPFTCAVRAVIGAVVLFALTMMGGRFVLSVLVDAFLRPGRPLHNEKDHSRERGN